MSKIHIGFLIIMGMMPLTLLGLAIGKSIMWNVWKSQGKCVDCGGAPVDEYRCNSCINTMMIDFF
jgi:hypothetical protein